MRYTVWALLLILTLNSYPQGRRLPESKDHPFWPLPEPSINSLESLSPRQPANGSASSPPGNPGTVSVAELRIPPKATHELEQSVKAYRSGNWRDSATHLEKVLVLYPQFSPAHNVLGRLYVNLHEYEKALIEFEKATIAEPGSAQELHNLSVTLYLLKRYQEAESTARATLEIDPTRPTTRYVLGCALAAEELFTAESVELLRQSTTQFPNARLLLANVLLKRGDVNGAEAELQAYLEVPNAPGKDGVQCWLAALTRKGQGVSCPGK